MNRQPQNETVLALSQILHASLNRSLYASPVNLLMPFLSLPKGAHRLAQGRFVQTNRLTEITWGEAHITHVSKESHHHNHYINQHYPNRLGNWSGPGTNPDINGSVLNQSASDIRQTISTTEVQRLPFTNPGVAITEPPVTRNIQHTNITYPEPGKPGHAGNVPANGLIEQSIINRTMAYRPLFLQSRHYNRQNPQQNHIAHFNQQYNPQLLGLLQGKKNHLFKLPIGKLINDFASEQRSQSHGKTYDVASCWSIPFPIEKAYSNLSVQNRQHDTNPASDTRPGKWNYADQTISNQVSMPALLINRLSAFNYAESMRSNTVIEPATLPAILPHRKVQGHLAVEHMNSPVTISKSFSEKIEKIVEQKLQAVTIAHNHDKANLSAIKNELKSNLRPERLVTDEMVRVLLKKIQKTMREERFRMGLMS